MKQGEFAGMISRRRFLEHLSRPYGLELFLQRPLTSLYRFAQTEILIFPKDTLIVEAARQSLHRPAELLYEPVVVEMAPRDYKLLDAHQLLVAQSHIHQLATTLLKDLYQQLETANQELQRLATSDGLTGVANRRKFDQYIEQEWRRLRREGEPLSLILCDVDFFKRYNDTYGHVAGDECLRRVAGAISSAVRRPADLVARYGGEEFAAILPNTGAHSGLYVAETIRSAVRALQLPHPKSLAAGTVTVSLGVSCITPDCDTSPAQLIAAADLALYQAKLDGRDCLRYASATAPSSSSVLQPAVDWQLWDTSPTS
ncbi:GGDEF domain-containing protein [Kamptonema formosum]|uniref:GGDEF domain-containing protein n=1 Tax=Kamptonema formosum TaxID=331992 RepID=UPI00034D3083|nr:GGDEF domain-containing protein [Oscillatoria sp. PCC 10802]